ncbi:chemotaxis protein CheW, partial [Archaeoglobales archaeon]
MSAKESTIQLVVFKLGSERYGVETSQVKEIIRVEEITRIPNAPEFV